MATNYYLPSNNTKTIITKITKTGHLASGRYGNNCEQPYCEVVINGKEKQLVYPCDLDIESYTSVELVIKKGAWGFDVIIEKRLVNDKKNTL